MKRPVFKIVLATLSCVFMPAWGAEPNTNDGELGMVSTGNTNLVLEVSKGVSAGFLRTNLDDPASDYQHVMSYRLIESLQQGVSTTIPFCIISSAGGSFAIDSFEQQGQQNRLESEFGSAIPFEVIIGDRSKPDHKFRAVPDYCHDGNAIPITIRMPHQLSGREVGRINGKFNLLIKTE